MAARKEQDNFVKLCGQGDLESVTQLLANDPSLIKAKGDKWPGKLFYFKFYLFMLICIFLNSYFKNLFYLSIYVYLY